MVAASRRSGADVRSGAGLAKAIAGADTLVDVTNSPSFDDDEVMDFFVGSTTNLVAAARAAEVSHYVALSIVGADELPDSGYLLGQGRPGADHRVVGAAVHHRAGHPVP